MVLIPVRPHVGISYFSISLRAEQREDMPGITFLSVLLPLHIFWSASEPQPGYLNKSEETYLLKLRPGSAICAQIFPIKTPFMLQQPLPCQEPLSECSGERLYIRLHQCACMSILPEDMTLKTNTFPSSQSPSILSKPLYYSLIVHTIHFDRLSLTIQ